jgi:antitoxin HigA-1
MPARPVSAIGIWITVKDHRVKEKVMSISRKGTPNWRVHPGEILREEFLKPMGMSPYALAKRLHVPPPRINDVVLERRGITVDTAVRLSRFFKTTEQFWLNLQNAYEVSRFKAERSAELEQIEPLKNVGARS